MLNSCALFEKLKLLGGREGGSFELEQMDGRMDPSLKVFFFLFENSNAEGRFYDKWSSRLDGRAPIRAIGG